MGIRSLLAIGVLAAGSVRAEAQREAAQPIVLVCMTSSETGLLHAQSIALKMFDEIQITIRWLRDSNACRSAPARL